MNIVILNYGCGNIYSVQNVLRSINFDATVCDVDFDLDTTDLLILPGVGSFDTACHNLQANDLFNKIKLYQSLPYKYVFGICLGMQLLLNSSEEGTCDGFGFIPGVAKSFHNISIPSPSSNLLVPHMGWNYTKANPLNQFIMENPDIPPKSRYYFVHSYFAELVDPTDSLFTTFYGTEFASAIHKDNVTGVQFHPEKSHVYGQSFLSTYLSWVLKNI